MSYIYVLILLTFLFSYTFLITLQLYKAIILEWSFRKLQSINKSYYSISQLLSVLQILLRKKLWFDALQLIESSTNVPLESEHQYFNAVGFIYHRMKSYNLAKLYYLKSLNKKADYLSALNNLMQIYEKI